MFLSDADVEVIGVTHRTLRSLFVMMSDSQAEEKAEDSQSQDEFQTKNLNKIHDAFKGEIHDVSHDVMLQFLPLIY